MSNLDIEAEVVASSLNLSCMQHIYDNGIRGVHFLDPVKGSALQWSIDYYENSGFRQVPTEKAMKHEFTSLDIVEPEESIVWLCSEVKNRYLANNIRQILLDVADIVVDDPKKALLSLQEKTWKISSNTEDRTHSSNMLSSIADRALRLEERRLARESNEITGVRIGYDEIDMFTGGLRPGELATVAGFAKAGKTWVGVNAAAKAMIAKQKVMFVTLELSIEEIEDRIDAVLSGVSYARQQSGALSKKELSLLTSSQEGLKDMGDILIEQPPLGRRNVQNIVQKAREFDADVLIIDQMSHMEGADGRSADELRVYRTIVSDLKREISRREEKQIPTILLAQMNRESQGRRHGRGDLSTLAGTSELERTADIVYGVSKSRQEAINSVSTVEILGSRRTDLKSWVVKTQLRDCTKFEVLREREETDE